MQGINQTNLIELNKSILELSSKIEIMVNSLEGVSDRVDGVADDISKIKEAVYNPDTGLYARLAAQDARIATLEQWKAISTRLSWVVVSVVTGLVIQQAWRAMFLVQ
ncbi:MAG TPA: hypothetical protein EYN67_04065 [Flavobacteriales bacterium]|jgi:hypothetical protein|nr:hypothetical protein [Flavobacteriales bacterium]